MPHISVCIITYRRPDGLKRLLESIARQTFVKTAGATVEVIVVDNDAGAPMRAMIDQARANFPWPLIYDVEPEPGIPFARNRCLDRVSDEADYVAFIDDDEEASERWLDELVWAAETFKANVVMGYVEPFYPNGAPDWIVQSSFFDWRQFEDGEELREGATSNALIRTDLIRRLSLRFDERLRRNGGDDFLFFRQTQIAGEKIIGSRGGWVREWHPDSRLTQRWLLQRRFRSGNSLALVDRLLDPSPKKWLTRLVKGFGRMSFGFVRTPINALRGRTALVQALGDIYWGAGSLAGLFGVNYEEYKTVHAMGGMSRDGSDLAGAKTIPDTDKKCDDGAAKNA
ncbi:MAG: glycosyltransferase family 2 protein [Pseudomonadota bacterium]